VTVRDFEITPARRAHGPALLGLFERTGCPCYCRYFHFAGDKNAWLDRCANGTVLNRAEMIAALDFDEMSGVVALDSSEAAIGWMKIAPAAALGKLYAQRLYKGLPCFAGDRSGVFSVACFLIDLTRRRQGVARALLGRGIELARERGAGAIEAFPRRAEGVADEQLWTGPASIFTAAGFVEVHEFEAYPVLRLTL
jgi:GNAT superfamily N-acetyltransferase